MLNEAEEGGWRNDILERAAAKAQLPLLRLADFFGPRADAHQGFAGFGGTKRAHLDCVYWCWSASLWAPALARRDGEIVVEPAAEQWLRP